MAKGWDGDASREDQPWPELCRASKGAEETDRFRSD